MGGLLSFLSLGIITQEDDLSDGPMPAGGSRSSEGASLHEQLVRLQLEQRAIRMAQGEQLRLLERLVAALRVTAEGDSSENGAKSEKQSTISDLPDFLLRRLLSRLPCTDDMARCACVCLRWRGLLKDATSLFTAFPHELAYKPLTSLSLHLSPSHLHRRLALHLSLLSLRPSFSHLSLSRLSLACLSPLPALLSIPSLLSSLTVLTLNPEPSSGHFLRPSLSHSHHHLQQLLSATPHLHSLTLHSSLWPACFPSLPLLSSLTRLCVVAASDWVGEACEAKTADVALLASLRSLSLKDCGQLSATSLSHLASLPALTSLDLSSGGSALPQTRNAGDGGLLGPAQAAAAALAALPLLLVRLQHVNVAFTASMPAGYFEPLTSLPSLSSIVIGIKEYSDVAVLKLVGQMTRLSALHVHCRNASDHAPSRPPVQGCCWSGLWDYHRAAFTFLSSLHALRSLRLSGFCSKCIESVLLHSRNLSGLRVLGLLELQQGMVFPSDSGIHRLSGLEELCLANGSAAIDICRVIRLPLQSSALRVVDLRGFVIAREAAAELSDIPSLRVVRLAGCEVKGEAAEELKWLPELQQVVIPGRRRLRFERSKVVFEEAHCVE